MVKAKGKEKINKVAFLWHENPWIYEAFTIPWLAKGAVIITSKHIIQKHHYSVI